MKKLLHIAAFLAVGFSTTAQETVELSMGANYENEVYLKLANETQNTYAANSWDIAFLRNSPQNIGIRVNDGIGIQVFEAADDPAEWNNINVANESSWTALYNDDTNWDNGAFMQGSGSYGWGEYNPVTHHVEGTIIFVLKYADGTYRKFINEDFFGGYTFKFATWDGNDWVNEKTVTVDNNDNPANRYNYYSLQNDETVIAEPAVGDWDMVFRKYVTDLGEGTYYNVTGVLNNPNVTVAQNEELDGEGDPNGLSYSEDINTIGYDWKSFDGSGYIVNSDMAYYVKYDESTIYRLVFTEFDGASSGNIELDYQDVSGLLGFEDVTEDISFGMYPNPTTNGQVSIVYDVANTASAKNTIEVFAINGAKVYSETLSSTSGFYNKTLDLSALQSGVYMVNVTSGKNTITKKLILK